MGGLKLQADPTDRPKRQNRLPLGLLFGNSGLVQRSCPFLQMSEHFGEYLLALCSREIW